MKPEEDNRLEAGSVLGSARKFPLQKLQRPEIVGQADISMLEALRRLWWPAFDRVYGFFVLIRLWIFDLIWGPEPPREQARTKQMRLLTVVLTLGLMLGYEAANAEGFDGKWAGTYTCGAHAFHPDWGPFTWSFPVAIQNGAISGAKRYLAGGDKKPATAAFDGSIDQGGTTKINVHLVDVVSTTENWHQELVGSANSRDQITLLGTMITPRGLARNCRLTLNLVAPSPSQAVQVAPAPSVAEQAQRTKAQREAISSVPAQAAGIVPSPSPSAQPPVVAPQDALNAERQRLKAQRQAIEAERQQVAEAAKRAAAENREAAAQAQRAAEDRKAAEAAQRQVEELKHQNAPATAKAEPPPVAANPSLPQFSTPPPASSPQETASSKPLSDALKIGIIVVILFGGILCVVLMMKWKVGQVNSASLLDENAAPGVLHDPIHQERELETESVGVAASGRKDAPRESRDATELLENNRATGAIETAGAPTERNRRSPETTDRAERHLAAIFAADIVGYSRRMEQDEVGTIRRLRDLSHNLIEPKITEYRGRIFKTMGDGFLAEFVSVVDAVHCAVDIQRMLAARNLDLPEDDRLNLRIGVNLGDVFREGQDVFGDGVNIATRLESIAPPGGIYISRAACDPIRERLAFDFEDLGEHHVKNITRPIEVFNVRIGGLAGGIFDQTRANSESVPMPTIGV
jgi:class 3 adenylate cyclase